MSQTLLRKAGSASFADCYARWSETSLVVGNACVERRWRVENGLLLAASLLGKASGYEWLAGVAEAAPLPEHAVPEEARTVEVDVSAGTYRVTGAEALQVAVTAAGAQCILTYHLVIFPETSAISLRLATTLAGEAAEPGDTADVQECLRLRGRHLRLRQVLLADQTDHHSELADERAWLLHPSERLALAGNLFILEDPHAGAGLVLLKKAPLPHVRPCPVPHDLDVQQDRNGDRRLTLRGHGTGGATGEGYAVTLLPFTGGDAGCTAALHRYQRRVRRYDSARDGLFLANTWGDRSQDARVTEDFMRAEVAAGARLGVDVIQIDDGWQAGRSGNSAQAGGVMEGFWRANDTFWAPHPTRFPRGLQPIIALAVEHGMQFGLWFNPDSADDYAACRRDTDTLLALYRMHGVRYFKIDGVTVRSRLGETRLHEMIATLLEASNGEIVIDFDITAGARPGYFGLMQAGPLFVENRYTDWHNYWPHHTLRALWSLARYIDPVRLRVEFLNNARNMDRYPNDPLAPACYAPDYLFATTMIASPLGWFEISNLPEDYLAAVAPLVRTWQAHRARLHGGDILPIGAQPDGTAWTGFASRQTDADAGYLLLFRELNKQSDAEFPCPLFPDGAYHVTPLAGDGTAMLSNGRVQASLPRSLSYLFARVEAT